MTWDDDLQAAAICWGTYETGKEALMRMSDGE